jgi:hypothetical protein
VGSAPIARRRGARSAKLVIHNVVTRESRMKCTRPVAAAVIALSAVAVVLVASGSTDDGSVPSPPGSSPPGGEPAAVLASGWWWDGSFLTSNRAW